MNKTNDHNVDCASCHIADRFVFPVLVESDDSSFMDYVRSLIKDKKRLTQLLMDNNIHVGRIASEFPIPRIFGYLDSKITISQRLVLDTAAAVGQANQLLGLTPVVQCVDREKRDRVLTCLYSATDSTLDSCMAKHCQ